MRPEISTGYIQTAMPGRNSWARIARFSAIFGEIGVNVSRSRLNLSHPEISLFEI